MIKLKDILTKKEAFASPITQKVDFNKPTVLNISKDELEMLQQDGRLEKKGITIILDGE